MRDRSSPGRRCCAQLFLKSRGGAKRTPVPQKLVSPGGPGTRRRGRANLPGARPRGWTGLSRRGQSRPRRQFGHGRGRASCRPPLGLWALCHGGAKRRRAGSSSSARPRLHSGRQGRGRLALSHVPGPISGALALGQVPSLQIM